MSQIIHLHSHIRFYNSFDEDLINLINYSLMKPILHRNQFDVWLSNNYQYAICYFSNISEKIV